MRAAIFLLPLVAVAYGILSWPPAIHAEEPAKISRHQVDLDFCRQVLAERRKNWSTYLDFARRKPDSLSALGRDSLDIVCYGSVVEPESDDIPRMIHIAAQAFTGLFVVDRAMGKRVEWRVGNETNDSLREAVKLHKEYYSASAERRDDRRGFISFALTAMAAHACDQGIPFDMHSEYIPMRLLRGDCFKEQKDAAK